jgi:hypothetical protein
VARIASAIALPARRCRVASHTVVSSPASMISSASQSICSRVRASADSATKPSP